MSIVDIKFDSDHDMFLSGADIAFTTTDADDALVQKLTIRLQFLLNEWFIDNTAGVPYTQFIFEKGSSLSDIYTVLRQEILNTEGVISIEKLEFTPSPDDKSLLVVFEVNEGTTAGTVEVGV